MSEPAPEKGFLTFFNRQHAFLRPPKVLFTRNLTDLNQLFQLSPVQYPQLSFVKGDHSFPDHFSQGACQGGALHAEVFRQLGLGTS